MDNTPYNIPVNTINLHGTITETIKSYIDTILQQASQNLHLTWTLCHHKPFIITDHVYQQYDYISSPLGLTHKVPNYLEDQSITIRFKPYTQSIHQPGIPITTDYDTNSIPYKATIELQSIYAESAALAYNEITFTIVNEDPNPIIIPTLHDLLKKILKLARTTK